jgi:hypothetical protein
MNIAPVSSGYTAHVMDESKRERVLHRVESDNEKWRSAMSGSRRFPLAGHLGREPQPHRQPVERQDADRGMEFGVSPFPESRRATVDRGRMLGVPTFRWLPARTKLEIEYWAVLQQADAPPESLAWPD